MPSNGGWWNHDTAGDRPGIMDAAASSGRDLTFCFVLHSGSVNLMSPGIEISTR